MSSFPLFDSHEFGSSVNLHNSPFCSPHGSPSKEIGKQMQSKLFLDEPQESAPRERKLSVEQVARPLFLDEEYEISVSLVKNQLQLVTNPQKLTRGYIYQVGNKTDSNKYEFLTKKESVVIKNSKDEFKKIAALREENENTVLQFKGMCSESPDNQACLVAQKIFDSFEVVKKLQTIAMKEEGQKIDDSEIFKICAKAQTVFMTGDSNQALSRPVLIDFDKKEFTIILGEAGKLHKEGKAGKVESVIKVVSGAFGEKPQVGHFVLKTPKDGHVIDDEEVRLTKQYQNGREFICNGKRVLVIEAFDGDLYAKINETINLSETETTGSLNDYKRNLCILRQLITQLLAMHTNGDTHLDLKLENILVRKMPNGDYQTQIADYGMSNSDLSVYGTVGYTAPEVIRLFADSCAVSNNSDGIQTLSIAPEKKQPSFTKEGQKAQDLYALGIVAFSLACSELPEWVEAIESSGNGKGIFNLNELESAMIMQKDVLDAIEIQKGYQDPQAQPLLDLIGQLLEPNPAKRITGEQFNKGIDYLSSLVA